MNIILYKNSAEDMVIDKTPYLTLDKIRNIWGELKSPTNIMAPIITIEYEGVPTFNYVCIIELYRYYYVSNIISVRNNIWEIVLREDIMMSCRRSIYNLTGFIDRNEGTYKSPFLVDNKRIIYTFINSEEIQPSLETSVIIEEIDDAIDYCFALSGYKIDVREIP